jgi:hypothetical protein
VWCCGVVVGLHARTTKTNLRNNKIASQPQNNQVSPNCLEHWSQRLISVQKL